MADRKITDLTALTTPASADVLPIVDVSEAAAADKNKKITVGELFKGVPDGTAAAPAIAFESDDGNGIFLSTTDTVGIATNGSSRMTVSTTAVTSTLPVIVPDGTAAAPSVAFTGSGTDTGIYSPGVDQVAVATNGTGRLFVDGSGRVGVGESSPTHKLVIRQNNSGGVAAIHLPEDESTILGSNANTNIRMGGNMTVSAGSILGFNTNGSERLRITSAGLVGIGTSSVDTNSKLHVFDSSLSRQVLIQSDTNDAALTFNKSGQSFTLGVDASDSNNFKINTGNTVGASNHITIDTSGRLGIGTTTVSYNLHVSGTGSVNSRTVATDASGDAAFYVQNDNSSIAGPLTYGTTKAAYGALDSGETAFYSNRNTTIMADGAASRVIKFASGGNLEKMRLDGSGRLLVGTSSAPTVSDAQYGLLRTQGNSSSSSGFGLVSIARGEAPASITSGEEIGYIYFTASDGSAFANIECRADANAGSGDYPGRLSFSTTADGASSPTERMRIQANGATKISTNGNFWSNGYYHEIYQHNTGTVALQLTNVTTGTPLGQSIYFPNGPDDSTTSYFIQGSDSTSLRFRIWSDGDVVNHDNSYGAISDEKLKQNIVDAGSQWDDLKNLRVRKFKFISDVEAYGDNAKTLIGLVAQEAETVSPGLVKESPDLDDENNDLGTVTKSVNYSVLYMKAVKALQEAMERIETLEAKVAALEAS